MKNTMIKSAEEFIALRNSEAQAEYDRSAQESAEMSVWLDIIANYPEYKKWVVRNKTVPIEILDILSKDDCNKVRGEVARKRKISQEIIDRLSQDENEGVRYDLMCNTKISLEEKMKIKIDDSEWLKKQLIEIANYASR